MNVDPAMLERAKLTQEGMAQFENLHGPARIPTTVLGRGVGEDGEPREETLGTEIVACRTCHTDWPCDRMSTMLIVQALAMLQSMIPSGNMGALLSRFSGNAR